MTVLADPQGDVFGLGERSLMQSLLEPPPQ
jgi:hypothetical protein